MTSEKSNDRTNSLSSFLLTLTGILIGFGLVYIFRESIHLIASIEDWIVLALSILVFIWMKKISQAPAKVVLASFFIGLLCISFLAKHTNSTTTIHFYTWCYGAELGLIGALLTNAYSAPIRFLFSRKMSFKLGHILLIILAIEILSEYMQARYELSLFLAIALFPLFGGMLAGLILRPWPRPSNKGKNPQPAPEVKETSSTPNTKNKPPQPSPIQAMEPDKVEEKEAVKERSAPTSNVFALPLSPSKTTTEPAPVKKPEPDMQQATPPPQEIKNQEPIPEPEIPPQPEASEEDRIDRHLTLLRELKNKNKNGGA